MAKKKSGSATTDAEEGGEKYSVMIDPDLVPKLKIVAAALGMSAPSYANTRLAKAVEQELEAAMAHMGFEPKKK